MTLFLHESVKTPLVAKNGLYKAVLITPGMGSSGYYSEDVLRASVDAFPSETHSYVMHSKKDEQRSPEKLLGVTVEDAWYEDGVGIVAELKPMAHWAAFLEEVGPYTGLSIQAEGRGSKKEMDGKEVFVVEALLPNTMNSVDLVSYAGRGGHIAESLYEEAVQKSAQSEPSAGTEKKEYEKMATLEEQLPALIEGVSKLVSAQEASISKVDADKAEAVKVAEAVKSAVEAARAVAKADLGDKLSEKLYAQIEALNFDVETTIAESLEVRTELEESLKAKLVEGGGSFASSGKDENYGVGRWS